MKSKGEKADDNNRRGFLRALFLAGAGIGLFSVVKGEKPAEKVKMLTPDGKLVEVNKSAVKPKADRRALNKEVLDWMNKPETR